MKAFPLIISLCITCVFPVAYASAKPLKVPVKASAQKLVGKKIKKHNLIPPKPKQVGPATPYRGWDYLVARLRKDGVTEAEIRSVYLNPKMPPFTNVSFALNPRESSAMYTNFFSEQKIQRAKNFMSDNQSYLTVAEKRYHVNRYVIASILLIESDYGRITGRDLIVNRLSRLAAIASRENISWNYTEQLKTDPTVTLEALRKRATYLEETFYPEIPAIFKIGRRNHINPLAIRGSSAGAFGLPQFLPSSFLRFGVDANKDGVVSLFDVPDAIVSAANFLHYYGWDDAESREHAREVLWNYNKSDAYVDGVLGVAIKLSQVAR